MIYSFFCLHLALFFPLAALNRVMYKVAQEPSPDFRRRLLKTNEIVFRLFIITIYGVKSMFQLVKW